MTDLLEITAQVAIMRERHRRGFCLPNFTPRNWWECDVFEVTNAGYFREYEIKLSISDLKADRRKKNGRWIYKDGRFHGREYEHKHELLKEGSARGPVQFWYVTPPGLVALDTLPEWAGLIEVEYKNFWWHTVEKKKGPRLHSRKIDPKVLDHARTIPYYRMHNLLYMWAERCTKAPEGGE